MLAIHKIKDKFLKSKILTTLVIFYAFLLISFTFLPKFAVSVALIIGFSCFIIPITSLFIIFTKIKARVFSKLAILMKLISIIFIASSIFFLNIAFDTMPGFNEYLAREAFLSGFFTLSGVWIIITSWYYFRKNENK